MTNPPIEADLNVAKPPALILELAFWSVDGDQQYYGVLILSVLLPCELKCHPQIVKIVQHFYHPTIYRSSYSSLWC